MVRKAQQRSVCSNAKKYLIIYDTVACIIGINCGHEKQFCNEFVRNKNTILEWEKYLKRPNNC